MAPTIGARPAHFVLSSLLRRASPVLKFTAPPRIAGRSRNLTPISLVLSRSYASRKGNADTSVVIRQGVAQQKKLGNTLESPNTVLDQQKHLGTSTAAAILQPGTFVPPPLFKHMLSDPRRWIKNLKARIASHGGSRGILLAFKFMSMRTLLSRPRFKIKRSSIVPTAKALHRAVWEGLATRDSISLRKIAHAAYFRTLSSTIDRRKRGRRLEWQLVKYNQPLFYPRVVDDRAIMLERGGDSSRQAVVAISTRQRLIEYDDTRGGVVVSEKDKDVLEYIVICSNINGNTYQQDEWKVFGFTNEMDHEQYEKVKKQVAAMEAEGLKKKTLAR